MATTAFNSLPEELRIKIMRKVTDFTSLRALVGASPSCHAAYIGAREEILLHVAMQQLDHRLQVDALAAVRSARFYELHPHEPKEVIAFLDQYRRARGAATQSSSEPRDWASFSKECSSLQEALALIHLHETVEHVANDYCLAVHKRQVDCSSLSTMERLRLHRALYRFQVYCNLFGPSSRILYSAGCIKVQRKELLRAAESFLPTFPPWEVQEVACVWDYLIRRWGLLLKEISVIVSPQTEDSDDSDWEDAFSYLRCGDALSEGISLFQACIAAHTADQEFTAATQEKKTVMVMASEELRQHLAHLGPSFIAETLSQPTLEGRHDLTKGYPSGPSWGFEDVYQDLGIPYSLLYPAERFEDVDVHAKLSLMPKAEQPSRGWKWYCHTYNIPSLGVGPEVWTVEGSSMHSGKHELSWGYPFWDEKRLVEWGIIIASAKKKKKKATVRPDRLVSSPLPHADDEH